MTQLNTALFCDGSLGEAYLKTITTLPQFRITGFCGGADQLLLEHLGLPFFTDPDALIEKSDVVIIVLPKSLQFELSKKTLKNQRHLFIERPFNTRLEEAETLLSMQREADVKIQTGSGLRLNKAYQSLDKSRLKPEYIETQNFQPGNSEASVLLDLMINDLDLVLHLMKSEVRRISANAVNLSNNGPDIVNARIEFGNGSVANLSAQRGASRELHTMRIYQKNTSAMVDFLSTDNTLQPESAYKLGMQKQASESFMPNDSTPQADLISQALLSFYDSVTNNNLPPVTLNDDHKALKLAYHIMEKIDERVLEG
jgi:predicted dehydrogenase